VPVQYELHRFAVWSNVFYFAPLLLAIYYHLVFVMFSLAFITLFSFAFHATDEREFVISDWVAAGILIFFNICLWYLGGMKPIFSALIILLGILALSIRYLFERGNRGGIAHGIWHMTAAIVTTVCVFAYALSA
jgi:hypothetical protein